MDANDIARRINDNLRWSLVVGNESADERGRPKDIWAQIELLLHEPDEQFVAGLYLVLLGRTPDSEGMAPMCSAMAAGMKRTDLIRNLALSDEARSHNLDVTWLSRLDEPPPGLRRFSLVGAFWRLTAVRPKEVWARVKNHWRRMAPPRDAID